MYDKHRKNIQKPQKGLTYTGAALQNFSQQ